MYKIKTSLHFSCNIKFKTTIKQNTKVTFSTIKKFISSKRYALD